MGRSTIYNARDPALAVDEGQIVAALRDPRTYADRPSTVTVIETHISWVFLTTRHAYKLKKRVKFDFLDFSTSDLRRTACENELQLNRRLAPDVYLEVLPVSVSARGRVSLGDKGVPVDWVVKMRRLPEERTLARQIRDGTLTRAEVDQTAERLADFYRCLPPLSIRTECYRQHIEQHVQANRHHLLDTGCTLRSARVRRVHAAQLRALRLWPEMFDERVCDGRIVEGHGDLRPDHIYLTAHSPTVIDCVEFNAEFRQLDVLDELCFLAMECEFLGAAWVGERIIEHYARVSGDAPPDALRDFYLAYRACVRAKVQALRAQQTTNATHARDLEAAEAYLRLADRHTEKLGPPLLLVVRGLTGVGKSTLATAMQESLGIDVLQTDAIRRELFHLEDHGNDFGEGVYLPANRQRVYHEMFARADRLLSDRQSVVLDGTFLSTDLRRQAALIAKRQRAAFLLVECYCDEDIAADRIAGRMTDGNSLSQSRPDFVSRQRECEEPDPSGIATLRVDTSLSLPAMRDDVFRAIRALIEADPAAESHAGNVPR